MRILAFFLHPYSKYGSMLYGSDLRFFRLSRWLKNLSVDIFALEYEPSLARSLRGCGYKPVEVNQKFKRHPILSIPPLMVYGIKLCIRHKINLVYSVDHFVTENVLTAFLVSCICKKPLAIVFHHIAQSPPVFSGFFRVIGTFTAFLKGFIYRRTEVCVAVSQATANDLKKSFGLKCVRVAGNGIDLKRYKAVKLEHKLFEAVYLGRVTSTKGVDVLLKSWKIVTSKLSSAKLLIMGGFEKDWLSSHKNLVEKLDLESNVVITGFISDNEAIRLLKSSKIFVLPSMEEGFGLSILEAMACGLPCILSDIPALRENFNSAAVFVNPKDIYGLASSIITLLSDSQKFSHLRRRSLETVERFTWKRVAEIELKALKEAL